MNTDVQVLNKIQETYIQNQNHIKRIVDYEQVEFKGISTYGNQNMYISSCTLAD